jgi:hypothetical protein
MANLVSTGSTDVSDRPAPRNLGVPGRRIQVMGQVISG